MSFRVVVTRPELPGNAVPALSARPDVEVVVRETHDPLTAEEASQLFAAADAAVVTGMDRLEAAAFTSVERTSRRPRVLATTSTGTDHIDVRAARAAGFVVTNVPSTMADTCADFTFGLILAARRRIAETDRLIRAGAWTHHAMHQWLGSDVHGTRLGLVGFGEIARAVARRAAGFAIDVVHHDRSGSASDLSHWVDLDELFATCDIVSLHVPLTAATAGLVDERTLGLMPPGSTLVNTSRGGVVDTAALCRALDAGRLHSVALDVFEHEPLAERDALLRFPNVVLAPHASSATEVTRASVVTRAVANVVAVLDGGRPLDPVDADPDTV